MDLTCYGDGGAAGGYAAASAALPLPGRSCPHDIVVDAALVLPFDAQAAGRLEAAGGAAALAAAACLGLQVALAPRDDGPQPGAHLVGVQRLLDDVGPRLQRAQQLLGLVAGGLVVRREDCRRRSINDNEFFFSRFQRQQSIYIRVYILLDRSRSHEYVAVCLLLRTVDDGEKQVGLDDGAEVEAAGGGLGGVGEDDVEAFELAGGEGLEGIRDGAAGHHCERETKSTHTSQ